MTATMLQAELWMSFVSVLRSYAAAASLHAGAVAVRSDENDVTMEAGSVSLAMRFDPESGMVMWTKRGAAGPAAAGRFEILADGVVLMNGTRRDLDHAAIDLVASVTEGTKGGRP